MFKSLAGRRATAGCPRSASRADCSDICRLCRTAVITAGFDPLRDEGAAYAQALERAGNQVTLRCEHDLTHGFINLGLPSPRCARALLAIADDVRRLSRA